MYADDINLNTTSNVDVTNWSKLLLKFRNALDWSIPKVNSKKSFTINCEAPLLNIKESNSPFRYLGFNFTPQSGLIDDFEEKVSHANNLLTRWFSPIFNKLAIMKTYAMSHLWFKAFVLGSQAEPVEKVIQSFLWKTASGKKRTLVSKVRARQTFTQGGLGIWDMQTRLNAFKANLIEKIKISEEMKIFQIFEDDFNKINSKTKNLHKLKLFKENRILANAWKCWLQFFGHLPDDSKFYIDQYNSINDLQAMKASSQTILTPRQQLYCSPEELDEVFTFVKKLKDKKLPISFGSIFRVACQSFGRTNVLWTTLHFATNTFSNNVMCLQSLCSKES